MRSLIRKSKALHTKGTSSGYTKVLGCLWLLTLAISACSSGIPLQIKPLSDHEWASHSPISVELLSGHKDKRKQISLVLRHDSRMDTLQLPLELSLENYRNELIWRDSIVLTLAQSPGHWQAPRVAIQEVSWQSRAAISVPYAGLYRLEVRSLRERSTPGVVAIGLGWSDHTK